jgi:hypothetical protein
MKLFGANICPQAWIAIFLLVSSIISMSICKDCGHHMLEQGALINLLINILFVTLIQYLCATGHETASWIILALPVVVSLLLLVAGVYIFHEVIEDGIHNASGIIHNSSGIIHKV